jgi:hypothetical protein
MHITLNNVFKNKSANDNKILLLRISFWIGAIVDGLAAIDMTWVAFVGTHSVLSGSFSTTTVAGDSYRFALGIAAALMWGWTFLLLWGDRKPVERKFLLPLTAFPVIFGIMMSSLLAETANLIPFISMIRRWIILMGIVTLFLFSFWNARNIQIENQ